MLVNLKTILSIAEEGNFCIPAFNVYNMETVIGVLHAAEEERAKRKEERQEKIKAALPLIKKIALIVLPMLIVSILAATILPKIDWDSKSTIENVSSVETSSDVTTSEDNSSIDSSNISSDTLSVVESEGKVSDETPSQATSSKKPSSNKESKINC